MAVMREAFKSLAGLIPLATISLPTVILIFSYRLADTHWLIGIGYGFLVGHVGFLSWPT